MAISLLQATPRTINAIRKADAIPVDLTTTPAIVQQSRVAKTTEPAGTAYTNGNTYICEIVSQLSPGVFDVKVFNDFRDPTVSMAGTLVAIDLTFTDVYYPGARVLVSAQYLQSFSVIQTT